MAREEYRKDMDSPHCYSVDMQKILLLPKLTTKEHFFQNKLICFNETFAERATEHDFAVVWHEGISGSNAADVSGAYPKF